MLETPARWDEVRTILEAVDDETVEAVIASGASIDEIAEAMHLIENNVSREEVPTTARVAEVREILHDARRLADERGPVVH
jgi:hypothetical protein